MAFAALDDTPQTNVVWAPQEGPQSLFLRCPVSEIFYGGARGGGKTDACLGEWMVHAERYGAHARGIFVRRVAEDLSDVILRSQYLFPQLGAKWRAQRRTWEWPNGAILRFRHLKDEAAAMHYQGHAYTRIYFEELGQWPMPNAYNLMRGALRSAHGVPCKIIGTGNPGGPGHSWLKARFHDPAPKGYTPIYDPVSEQHYVFIPAKLEDNPILRESDPTYEKRLLVAGNEELVKAWRHGVWDLVIGAYFSDVWDPRNQLLQGLVVPDSWTLRRSFDWGQAVPSSLGVWAISSGEPVREGFHVNRLFPAGTMVRIGEWYTVQRDHLGNVLPNVGLRLGNTELGQGIAKLSAQFGRPFSGCVADTNIFQQDGSPSGTIYAQMQRGASIEGHHLAMSRANKTRVAGWQKIYQMLGESAKAVSDGPGMYYTSSCTEFRRTIPLLQMDARNPEDVDTDGEDHVGDESRYGAMAEDANTVTAVS